VSELGLHWELEKAYALATLGNQSHQNMLISYSRLCPLILWKKGIEKKIVAATIIMDILLRN